MRQLECSSRNFVVNHNKPPGQALPNIEVSIGKRCVTHLNPDRTSETSGKDPKLWDQVDRCDKIFRFHRQSLAIDLRYQFI